MGDVLASRIYDLKIANYDDSIKKVQALTTAFNKLDSTKRKLNDQLQKKVEAGDTAAVDALTKRIAELEKSLASLSKQKATAKKETDLLLSAEQAYAKSELDAIKQVKDATKYTTELSKEKDKALKASQKQAAANEVEAGSYRDVRNQLSALKPFIENKQANSSSTINVGGSNLNISQAIAKFKELSFTEQEFRRQFQADGTLVSEYSSGIINAFNKLGLGSIISKNKADIQGQLRVIRTENEQMAASLQRSGIVGSEGFGKIENKLRENITLQEQLEKQLLTINTTLANTGSVGQKITAAIGNGFKDVKSHINNVLVTYIGFQAALNEGQKLIKQNYDLSDSIAQIQIYLKGSKENTDQLVESIKKIPTRTAFADLIDIATVVTKKGVAKEEIAGVTKALDQLFVVLGKEIGDPHEAVSSLVKLVNVYSEDKHVTAKNIGDVGAAIQKLTSSGVATGSFLIQFAERLAGVRGITGVSIQNVLGLGAALEELGQRSEVAGTAASQLVIKLFSDIPKYAGYAGKSVEEFSKTVNTNPVEALIQLAQGLKTNKSGLDEVAQAFDAAGVHGARVLGVLGDIAGNADYMRKRLEASNKAFGDQASLVQNAAIKQNTFAATLDLIRKKFELLGTNKSFQNLILGIGSAIAFLLGNLGIAIPLVLTIIGLTNSWAGTLVRLTAAYALQIAAWIVERAQLIATNAVRVTTNFLLAVYTAATIRATVATGLAAVGFRVLAAAIAFVTSPLGIVLGLLAIVTTTIAVFTASAKSATAAISSWSREMKIRNEIHQEAVKNISAEKAETDRLVATVNNLELSLGRRQAAMDELNKRAPQYFNKLTIEQGKYVDLTKSLGDYNNALLLNAELQVSSQRNTKAAEDFNRVVLIKDDLTLLQKGTLTFDQISDEAKQFLEEQGIKALGKDKTTAQFISRVKSAVTTMIADSQKYVKTTENIFKDAQKKVDALTKPTDGNTNTVTTPVEGQTLEQLKQSLTAVKNQIATLDKIKTLTDGQKKQLEDLRKQRHEIQSKIKELGGSTEKFRGSKLSVGDREEFKTIDATRDQDLADQKLKRAENLIDEETYLKAILAINQKAIDEKLKLLNGSNAEEKKVMSQLKLDRITIEQETNNKLFEERKKSLKAILDEQIRDLQESNRIIQDDPTISANDKANKKQQTDQAILNLTITYGQQIATLEKQYGQQSIENAKEVADKIRDIKEDLRKDEKEILQAQLADAESAADKDLSQFKKIVEAQRLAIVQSNKPQKKKDLALENLKNEEDFGVLAREVARDTIEKEIYEKLLKAKVITQEQYDNFLGEAYKREQQLHDAGIKNTEKAIENVTTLGQLITNKISSVFGFDDGTKAGAAKEKLLAETIAQSYQLAQNAMNNYFEAEKANIERSKQLAEKRIDLEKEQALSTAQSQAERDAIEREAQVKKDKADRDAFEKNKKIQLAQAKINLGIQLANLAVIAFAPNPANIATLGVAGAIMYGIQAALAIANYISNTKRISSAQYATGGFTGPGEKRDSTGHKVAGVVHEHEWVAPKWMVTNPKYSGVIGALESERKKGYATGGYTGLDYSGPLGENLNPPYNPSEFLNPKNGGSSVDMRQLFDKIDQQSDNLKETARQIHQRIDKIKVQVVAGEVEKTNNDVKKVIAMGTL